ncbi:MAG: flavodoxin family protein [FCB group bacterium]|nr:flavodoxin family protein [FCB group bacterium]
MPEAKDNKPFVLGLSGSPVISSSTELLVREVLKGAESKGAETDYVYLNELDIMPCQACGQSPEEEYCFFHDGMDVIYEKFDRCDAIVVGSPLYFDSVSAQTKLFIDRCNCFRRLTPDGPEKFVERIEKKRTGAIVLVGGEREKYEHARRVIGGFYVWANITSVSMITHAYDGFKKGTVAENPETLQQAFESGLKLID